MLTRRDLLARAGALGVAGMATGASAQDHSGHGGAATLSVYEQDEFDPEVLAAPESGPLPIPELVDARDHDGQLHLSAAASRHRFAPNFPTSASYGYNGSFLGPTLRLRRGESVEISVENRLPEMTTAHWHGLLIPAWLDGGPHNAIEPGETWAPVLEIDQGEATCWYHAHPHHATGWQVHMGLAGMIYVEDGTGERLGLPRDYGVDDIPLVLQDRMFTEAGEQFFRPYPRERILGLRGDMMVVNGAISPHAAVPAGLVRLRLLNGANARNFHLHFSDGREFHVVATDGGYIRAPAPVSELTISPGERFEIVVDFSDGAEVELRTHDDEVEGHGRRMGRLTTRSPSSGNLSSQAGTMVHFRVDPELPVADNLLPERLVSVPQADARPVFTRRSVALEMWPEHGGTLPGELGGRGQGPAMSINGKRFDMDRIDFAPTRGSVELWEIHSHLMPHPFHVHGAFFRIVSLDGARPPAHLDGWKDTVLVEEHAEIAIAFDQPATRDYPFMFHCHILEHEDGDMMGQFITV